MEDSEVRAELGHINFSLTKLWDREHPGSLRLLAECWLALGEIDKCATISYKGYTEMFPIFPDSTSEDDAKRMTILGSFQEIIKLARNVTGGE